ncbi:YbjQ family protein [Pyruvatibacter sp. HU-CL02332]|uniref:YbjQ family protein n=1 Tax=Pyruvatibacter sp. HU-CL02332 TaxID=3127650 RepID=UPI003103DC1A
MLVTTTNSIEGRRITEYKGLVAGEAVTGANVVRDIFAGLRDFFGGRSGSYEKVFRSSREAAIEDMVANAQAMGANAVVGVDIDYESVGAKGSILMATACGTAVVIE